MRDLMFPIIFLFAVLAIIAAGVRLYKSTDEKNNPTFETILPILALGLSLISCALLLISCSQAIIE